MYSSVCYMVGEYEKNMCFELTKTDIRLKRNIDTISICKLTASLVKHKIDATVEGICY
jgi:hypothetical protein